MPRTKKNGKNLDVTTRRTVAGNTFQNVKKTATANKKQMPVDIKIPSARERAKEFDEARRHDAESNEL